VRPEKLMFHCPSCKEVDTKEMAPTKPLPRLNQAPAGHQTFQNP
jgi:hypothetical protein